MSGRVKTPAAIKVRALEIDDLPRVQEIDHKTTGRFRAYTYDEPSRNCLGGDLALSYVAEIDGQVVGFVFGWLVDGIRTYREEGARLQILGVDPAFRRKAVGRHLLNAFLQGCQQKNIRNVHILVHSRDRDLKAFLAKFHFVPGELVDYEVQIPAAGS